MVEKEGGFDRNYIMSKKTFLLFIGCLDLIKIISRIFRWNREFIQLKMENKSKLDLFI